MAYRTANPGETLGGGRTTEIPEAPVVNKSDTHIKGVYFCLLVISVVELYSASSFEIAKQGLYGPLFRHVTMLLFGLLIVLGLERVHFSRFIRPGFIVILGSVLAMVYVLCFGEVVNGAKRAITLPFMTLQPSEFIKLSAVLALSYILGTTQLKKDEKIRTRGLAIATGLVLGFGVLLFTQGLTNTLILMALCISMLIVGALEVKKFWYVMLAFAVAAALAMCVKMMMSSGNDDNKEVPVLVDQRGQSFVIPDIKTSAADDDSRMRGNVWWKRFAAFFDSTPRYERELTGDNIQEQRSYMAQAHGGMVGVMPGNSRETSRLPLAFSDFIYAIIVEDIGFVGGIFVMLLYLWLLARAYFIAYKCNQMYPAFLVTGCALLITLQALCHMMIVSGAGPVSGQPLPLISKGGTSILVTSIAFGIMLSVSRYAARGDVSRAEAEYEKNTLPTELQAQNPTQI